MLIRATKWMKLENVMLSEGNHTQKATYCVIPFIQNVQNRETHRDREQISDCQGMEKKRMGSDCK